MHGSASGGSPTITTGEKWLHRFNLLLALPALLSLLAGIRHAVIGSGSHDLQWSGARLVLHRVDPFAVMLAQDPDHRILLAQIPNYLHELYILLLPLGALSFEHARVLWAACNCLFTLALLVALGRIYALDRTRILLLACLLLSSTPFRMALGNGQQSLLELLLFTAVFLPVPLLGRGLSLGLSYAKYSFSPPLFLFLLFRRQFRLLAISLLPPLLGLFFTWLLVRGNLFKLAFEPFLVGRTGVEIGPADLMSQIRLLMEGRLSPAVWHAIMLFAGLLSCILFSSWLSRQRNLSPGRVAALLSTASLLFLTHLTYDFVFLAVPLAAALRGSVSRVKASVLGLITLFWWGIKFGPNIEARGLEIPLFLLCFAVLCTILGCVGSRAFADPQPAPPFDDMQIA